VFSNFYFGDLDKNGMTSSFATEIQKGYRELFKTPGDVFVEKIFDLYNKAILANCHPKDMVDNMQYINAHIYNLAVHDATKSLSDGKTVEKYINDLSHKITMTVDPLAIVTADLPVITSTTTTDLPF
jgi:hypothetical protein